MPRFRLTNDLTIAADTGLTPQPGEDVVHGVPQDRPAVAEG